MYQLYLVHCKFISTVHFSNILMVIKDPRFKSCQGIYATDFSFFGNQISGYISLSVINCNLVENILHIFGLGQI